MHLILEGGTDAASMVIFDPGALPGDFDAKNLDAPTEQLEQLTQAGRLYWINTEADGAYSLGIYLAAGLPPSLAPYANSVEKVEKFHIPSGRLFFTGVEYVFQDDDSRLRKFPGMRQAAELPKGVYRMEFMTFDYPEDFHENLLRLRLPAGQFRIRQCVNTLVALGCLSLLGMCVLLPILKWAVWTTTALPIGLTLIALLFLVQCLPGYQEAAATYQDIQREFPDYGIILRLVTMG